MKSKLILAMIMATSMIANSARVSAQSTGQPSEYTASTDTEPIASEKNEKRGKKNKIRKYELVPMTIFPETVDNSISVSIPFSSKEQGKVNIYNERGTIVHYQYFETVPNTFEVAIPESVAPGKYFIQVIAEDKHAIQKFVKK